MAAIASDSSGLLSGLIIFAVVALITFLILRELVCWYYKINEMNKTLHEMAETLHRHSNAWTDHMELMRQQQNRLAEMAQLLVPPVTAPSPQIESPTE